MIQLIITRKCNFLCDHCMWSCNKRGEHMSWGIFSRALNYAKEAGAADLIGGEPTLHPLFGDMVDECSQLVSAIRIATNGSWAKARSQRVMAGVITAVGKAAAKLGKDNVFVRLSDDQWHHRFISREAIDLAHLSLWGLCNLYVALGDGVIYPLGRAREGEMFNYVQRQGYDTAPAECTKGKYSFWRNASIDIDGSVSPCTHHQAVCGNIMKDNKDVIIRRANEMIKLRRRLKLTNIDCAACSRLI